MAIRFEPIPQYQLIDGQLVHAPPLPGDVPAFADAPFFSDIEEAQRWLDENEILAEVSE